VVKEHIEFLIVIEDLIFSERREKQKNFNKKKKIDIFVLHDYEIAKVMQSDVEYTA
jgi:hypothetical protein